MKRKDWEVKDEGIRPAGRPDLCFYCGEQREAQHKPDCVIRSRTVVLEYRFQVVVDLPEFWAPEFIESHRNNSSWCANNALSELDELSEKLGCLCDVFEARFVREATPKDEAKQRLFVEELPS